MPLAAAGLQADLETLFGSGPDTAAQAAQEWADAVQAYFAGVIPSSLTVAAAATTLAGALTSAFSASSGAAAAMESAFSAFAATVGGGMAPAFVATPPPGPVGFSSLLSTNQATQAAAAQAWASAIDTWAKTGTATPSAGGSPVNWS